MKHLRIYESYRGDKVIKLYNNSILHDYQINIDEIEKNKKRIEEFKNKILSLINEYYKMNSNYFANKYYIYYKMKDFYFYIDDYTNRPYFSLTPEHGDNVWLVYKDIEDLLDFMKDPDLYRNTKRYNL